MGTVTEGNSDEKDEMAIGKVRDSHPHDDQQLVGYSDIIGTVTEEDNSDEEDEMEVAVSESQPPHGDQQLVSYADSDSDGESCNLFIYIYLFIHLFILSLKVDKHQIQKTVYIKKVAMYKVIIYTC